MTYTTSSINDTAIIVLKEDDSGNFYTEYVPIEKDSTLLKLEEDLKNKLSQNSTGLHGTECTISKTNTFLSFWNEIKIRHPFLFDYRNYCYSITSTYISTPWVPINHEFEFIEYDKWYPYDIDIKVGQKYLRPHVFVRLFLESYFIEIAYNICKRNTSIKAYSNQRIGRTSYYFELNSDFSINIQTNFGYGFSCYFCVTLIFKGIQIIPYSRLVNYYFAGYLELIRNTWDFVIDESSWELAFDKVKAACNTYRSQGENPFIKKYFTDEVETLTKHLQNYLTTNTFNLSENQHGNWINQNDDKWQEITLEGYPLIIFRGEKISGSIGFVGSIKRLESILPTSKYIDTIIDCSKKIAPDLKSSLNKIDIEIGDLENISSNEKDKLNEYENQFTQALKSKSTLNDLKFSIKKEINIESQLTSDQINLLITERIKLNHPELSDAELEFENINTKVENQKRTCSELYSMISALKSNQSTISNIQEKILSFLETLPVG